LLCLSANSSYSFSFLNNGFIKLYFSAALYSFNFLRTFLKVISLSALTAVLAVFLGNYFYVKFGGKANNVKNIIVAAVSLVVLVLACVGIYYVEVGSVIAANNLNMTPFELIFSDEELKGYFISDMAMNVIFTIIGVVAQIASTKRNDQSSRTRVSQ
jgi:hypothetical protein